MAKKISTQLKSILKKNIKEYNKELPSSIQGKILSNFEKEKDINGNDFAELKARTREERLEKGYGVKPILQRTKKLKKSIKTSAIGNSIKVSSNVSYAQELNDGRSNMLPRPFLEIPESFKEGKKDNSKIFNKYLKKIEKELVKAIESFGFKI